MEGEAVGKRHKKTYGVDYNATYAPVVDFDHVRMMMAIAENCSLQVEQMHVKQGVPSRGN